MTGVLALVSRREHELCGPRVAELAAVAYEHVQDRDLLTLGRLGLFTPISEGAARTRTVGQAQAWSTWWAKRTARAPSPTAPETRFVAPARTSPAAKTPGQTVSSRCG
jgi:hypothetical protein